MQLAIQIPGHPDAAHVEQVVRGWRRIDRSVEAREDELRDAASTLSTHVDENGMYVIRGRLAPEAGELLMKALQAAAEKLFARESKDRPPIGKQRADALALLAESALASDLTPTHAGDRYQVVMHVNEDELHSPCAACEADDRRHGSSAASPTPLPPASPPGNGVPRKRRHPPRRSVHPQAPLGSATPHPRFS